MGLVGWYEYDGTMRDQHTVQGILDTLDLRATEFFLLPRTPEVHEAPDLGMVLNDALRNCSERFIEEKSPAAVQGAISKYIHSYWTGVTMRGLKDNLKLHSNHIEELVDKLQTLGQIKLLESRPIPNDRDANVYRGSSLTKRIIYSFILEPPRWILDK